MGDKLFYFENITNLRNKELFYPDGCYVTSDALVKKKVGINSKTFFIMIFLNLIVYI